MWLAAYGDPIPICHMPSATFGGRQSRPYGFCHPSIIASIFLRSKFFGGA
jgi:hypothetical protein